MNALEQVDRSLSSDMFVNVKSLYGNDPGFTQEQEAQV